MISAILLMLALFIGALLLIAAEICTPTFGVLAAAALACLAGMVYVCFTQIGQVAGIVMIVVLVFVIPAYLWAAIKYLPNTPLGRVLQLRARRADRGEGTPQAAQQQSLVGRTAVAATPLRPSGAIRVGTQRVVATAESGFIPKGATVEIIKASGPNVVVREVDIA